MKAKKQNVLFTLLPFYLFTFKKLGQTIRKLTPREKRRICRENSSHRSRLE